MRHVSRLRQEAKIFMSDLIRTTPSDIHSGHDEQSRPDGAGAGFLRLFMEARRMADPTAPDDSPTTPSVDADVAATTESAPGVGGAA